VAFHEQSTGGTVVEQLEIWSRTAPDRVAMEFRGQGFTYRGLDDEVCRLSQSLLDLGVQTRRPDCGPFHAAARGLRSLPGVRRNRCIFVGVNPRYTRHELRHVIGNCQPELFFSLTGFEDRGYREDVDWATAGLEMPVRVVLFDDERPLRTSQRRRSN